MLGLVALLKLGELFTGWTYLLGLHLERSGNPFPSPSPLPHWTRTVEDGWKKGGRGRERDISRKKERYEAYVRTRISGKANWISHLPFFLLFSCPYVKALPGREGGEQYRMYQKNLHSHTLFVTFNWKIGGKFKMD